MEIEISKIMIGVRRREAMGDIEGMAKSLRENGQLEPISIDQDNRLIFGERRIRAALALGWTKIRAERLADVTPERLRKLEFEENERRKDLTAGERARRNADIIRDQIKALAEEAAAKTNGSRNISSAVEEIFDLREPLPKRGRGKPKGTKKPDAVAHAATAMNMSPATASRTLAVDKYVREFALLDRPTWSERAILKAGKLLDEFENPDEQKAIAGMLDQKGGISPEKTIQALEHLIELAEPQRAKILEQYHSDDPREQSNAITLAVGNPPNPDPRIFTFLNLERDLKSLRKDLAVMLKKYPDDKENKLIEKLDSEAGRWQEALLPPILEALRKRSQEMDV